MILVDSSVWIDYFRGVSTPQTNYLDAALGREMIAIGDLVLAEVLQGFTSDRDFAQARRLFDTLEIVPIGGVEAAYQAAQNFRQLRRQGVAVRKTIDCLIATRCILDGYRLLHSDRDFDAFVELGLDSVL
ncbi:PIN domain nuclease [Brevundimonas sp. SORGH_AS_0993]|uniref:type II toxin-antitoxin system VapC family toxin n=1 Tax=Brevundimonas sp. SORGH_AS_0993 TaxID=3041794 RepID=UPI0027837E57|nr:PIN domain nuclease [Brevundimonas sp. SORGH_AS_0993]MDQ1153534.1 putative nucleic acid-binding protein [Brevundimonas sp. SORGH_AS_0993]